MKKIGPVSKPEVSSKNRPYIKRMAIAISAIAVASLIVIPVLVNALYNADAPIGVLAVKWTAKDYLNYFGSVLGGLGTVFLGIITIHQSRELKKRDIDREDASVKRPFFIVSSVENAVFDSVKWGKAMNGYILRYTKDLYSFIKLQNIGDGAANNVVISPWADGETSKSDTPCFSVPANGWNTFPIPLYTGDSAVGTYYYTVFYENMIGYAYSQMIEVMITSSLEYEGTLITKDGKPYRGAEGEFVAEIYNIYPQQPLGMGQFDRKTGTYLCDENRFKK